LKGENIRFFCPKGARYHEVIRKLCAGWQCDRLVTWLIKGIPFYFPKRGRLEG
jgi:hypothetical protein